jgi:hypothetical protein
VNHIIMRSSFRTLFDNRLATGSFKMNKENVGGGRGIKTGGTKQDFVEKKVET